MLFLAALAASGADVQAQRSRRVGVLWNSLPQADLDRGSTIHRGPQLLEEGLRELGWQRGKNLELIHRSAESQYARMPAMADEFVRLPVDVLVVFGPEGAEAAQAKTKTIPIVWAGSYVLGANSRPQGNVTGASFIVGAMGLKRVELLKALAPRTAVVAVLGMAAEERHRVHLSDETIAAARKIGISLVVVHIEGAGGLERAFEDARRRGANAAYVSTFPELTWSQSVRAMAVELPARYKLPTVYDIPSLAKEGALLAYGADDAAGAKHAARYIDRLLRGAKPSDLPIETIDKVELNVNRATARRLGLEIPAWMLVRADNVFE